jgi:hypothetical protein
MQISVFAASLFERAALLLPLVHGCDARQSEREATESAKTESSTKAKRRYVGN